MQLSIPHRFFNSHPHKEDDKIEDLSQEVKDFSTHILTRRMTLLTIALLKENILFNSHPHKEDDGRFVRRYDFTIAFQLTSSQGG